MTEFGRRRPELGHVTTAGAVTAAGQSWALVIAVSATVAVLGAME